MSRAESTAITATVPKLNDDGPPVDWRRLLQAADGDEDFARELIDVFLQSAPDAVSAIIEGLQDRNYAALAEKAHEIKGSTASLQAIAATLAAARLEAAARAGDVDQIVELANDVVDQINRTVEYLGEQKKKTSFRT